MKDLIVLVADADTEQVIKTLLNIRCRSLHIRPINFEVVRHPNRDAGVYRGAPELLRAYARTASYALVLLDREGSGGERRYTASEMEQDLEQRLRTNGWVKPDGNSRCAVIVLDPELETWVWSGSPHVAAVLGLDEATLGQVLEGFERHPNGKPRRPKEALQAALRRSGRPFSAAIFAELARRVSLQGNERAFDKFRATLQKWFSEETLS